MDYARFLRDELRHNSGNVQDGRKRLAAVESLVQLNELWAGCGWRLTPLQLQTSMDLFNRFIAVTEGLDMDVPKRHGAAHLIFELQWFGNPRYYSNWRDESWNKQLKACCRQLSQQTFDICVLASMRQVLLNHYSKANA